MNIQVQFFQKPLGRFAICVVIFFMAVRIAVAIANVRESFSSDLVYRKDFFQDYVMARAAVIGVDPYLPIAELKETFFPGDAVAVFLHSSPHPPSALLLFSPFAFVSYTSATMIWLGVSACLVVVLAGCLVHCATGKRRAAPFALAILALGSSNPIDVDLMSGQVHVLLAVLLFLFIASLEKGKDIRAGLCLGLCLSLKYFGWPIALYLLLRRKWQALAATLSVVLFSHLAAVVLIGQKSFTKYFSAISPSVFRQYLDHEQNQSLWALAQRIFGGAWYLPELGVRAAPLVNAPSIVPLMSVCIVAAIVVFGLMVAIRTKDESLAFGILVALSFLVTPIAWMHTGIVVVVALGLLWRALESQNVPRGYFWMFFVICAFWHIGNFPVPGIEPGVTKVSFWLGLAGLVPMFVAFGIGTLSARLAVVLGRPNNDMTNA